MSVREAERAATDLLSRSWWGDQSQDWPLPVDPFHLARELGIQVVTARLASDESGNIAISAAFGALITLNREDSDNRQRFTCSHEIGHYLRRAEQGMDGDKTYVDRRSTLAGMGVSPDEIYANQFAAALLMPAHLVQRWLSEGSSRLARRLGTSEQAMNLRIRNLNLG